MNEEYKIYSYFIAMDPIKGQCKQPSLWGYEKEENNILPLIYFQKPKWLDEESFKKIVKSIKLEINEEIIVKEEKEQ